VAGAQLLACGRVARPYIGIKMLQLTRENAALLARRDPAGLPAGTAGGVLVPHVAPRSPAARAGLRPGDVIVGAPRRCLMSLRVLGGELGAAVTALEAIAPSQCGACPAARQRESPSSALS